MVVEPRAAMYLKLRERSMSISENLTELVDLEIYKRYKYKSFFGTTEN